MLARMVEQAPDKIAYCYKDAGRWVDVTWRDQRAKVDAVAKALIACGVEPGDRVAILSEDRPEWLVTDVASLSVGAISVGIYPTAKAAG